MSLGRGRGQPTTAGERAVGAGPGVRRTVNLGFCWLESKEGRFQNMWEHESPAACASRSSVTQAAVGRQALSVRRASAGSLSPVSLCLGRAVSSEGAAGVWKGTC